MRRSKRKKNQYLKLIATAFVLLGCTAGLGTMLFQAMGQKVADEYGCYDDIYSPQTALILDASEPRFDELQARSLLTFVDKTYDELAPNERFSVFTTEADVLGDIVKPRFHLCGQASSPQEQKELTGSEATTAYLRRLKETFYEELLRPQLHKLFALEADQERQQRNQSPILEMVQAVVRDQQLESGDRLFLMSDLVQSSDSAQFCRQQGDMPLFSNFAKRRIYQRLKPRDMDGIDVTILMLLRGGYGSTGYEFCRDEEEIADFWRDYFEDNGARVEVIRIRPQLADITPVVLETKKPLYAVVRDATSTMTAQLSANTQFGDGSALINSVTQ